MQNQPQIVDTLDLVAFAVLDSSLLLVLEGATSNQSVNSVILTDKSINDNGYEIWWWLMMMMSAEMILTLT